MRIGLSHILFPPSCSICGRNGFYICPTCHKLFKKNLPECYICRRVSNGFKTHEKCKHVYSFDSVFVAWEYNRLSANLLKRFKYKSITDIKYSISDIFYNSLQNSSFKKNLRNTLLIPVPISNQRLRDRGFNQTELIVKQLEKRFCLDTTNSLLKRIGDSKHHSLMDKEERALDINPFAINNRIDITKYKSITILDDVITTGNTLESISKVLRSEYGKEIPLQAICMFRGKPYYSEDSV